MKRRAFILGFGGAGAWPLRLSAQQPALPVKVEMIVNLKAARTLGITVSLPIAGRADEIIE